MDGVKVTFKHTMRVLLVGACLAAPAVAQEPLARKQPQSEVLVVGTFHMANPGRDLFNTKVDDVLSPGRQKEMAQVIAALRKFNPTKIAVERAFTDKAIGTNYAAYKAGTYELTRNEVDQLGFRLAKELGLDTVHAVDAGGEFPFPRLTDYAKANGRGPELDSLLEEIGTASKAESAYLASHTLLEGLLHMNSDEQVAQWVGFYYRQAHFGQPWNWAGADLLADWSRRNLRIYSNIMHLIGRKQERVLVIYGAGHLGWLRQMFEDDPTTRLRKLSEFGG